ncbi:GPP34 family phosphoprotein [Haloechinothrix sp. LS1_15]|uniref:GOLPH3/VPS74 family protein n=1 Tax=Haloechinothrix sp. LS1_15 TaxID=2652248 RepID=UPI002944ADFA|nr:GPP34 family phosphoprotein [Haloechinothrix sp. LS1_15]MDV6012030.1 GPP34 family phosphoprotein [Haloechinothrix sp. LS1_15]
MMLAEDLLLLSYDDDTGRRIGMSNLEYALAGAVLIELVEHGRIDVAGEDDASLQVSVADDAPVGHRVLDEALATVAGLDGHKPKDAVLGVSGSLATRLLDELTERGIADGDEQGRVRILPVNRWPTEESGHEYDVRARLRRALAEDEEPDERTAALISLLAAIDAMPRLTEHADRSALRKRAKTIAEGEWAPGASKRAIEEFTAVVMVAALAPAVMSAGG